MSTRNEDAQQMPISRNSVPNLKLLDFCLRISAVSLTLASLCLTVTNTDDNPDYGNIKFLNFVGLKYIAVVASIAAAYALFAAISHWLGSLLTKVWIFFVSDQVMAYLMVTSGAAGGELLYLAYKGDVQVSWSEACSTYAKFCRNLRISLALHFLAVFCFLLLAVISAFRAFRSFPPPLPDKLVDVNT